ncbi:MAG TPA: dipeptidase [Saprospiraceae bacterium]|nr:dipeptidase [Saprospiraceae bacterium]HMP25980.1 dipeptidase [Saprospiraceae bacterium]
MIRTIFLVLIALLNVQLLCAQQEAAAAAKPNPWEGKSDEELRQIADSLAQKFIITDGHVDLPYRLVTRNFRLTKELIGIPIESEDGDFDYVRARKGGLDAPFMSIYIPSSYQETGGAKAFADSLINMVQGIAQAHPDKFSIARRPSDVRRNFERGIMSLPMGMENGAPIEDDIKNVEYFHKRGIRYITLTHGKDNQICDSSYDTTQTWNGLSPFGREVIKEMNRVGIMVDISHVSDSAFYQAVALSSTPCIASHSSVRYFTPDFQRNMNDDMIKFLADRGGVIQINFGSSFLDQAVQNYQNQKREELRELLAKRNLKMTDAAARPVIEEFRKKNPALYSDVEKVADHIDHVVKLVGIKHVGLGSDFDGVGDSLPTGLKDVSQYPNLIYALLKRGYSESDIEKICSGNVLRVWDLVDRVAQFQERARKLQNENENR